MKAAIKVIPIILIIAAFSAILSVNSVASYGASNLSYIRINSFNIDIGNYQWVLPSYSVSNNSITVNKYSTTGVNKQRFQFRIDKTYVTSLDISFTIELIDKTYDISASGYTGVYKNVWNNNNLVGELEYTVVDNSSVDYNFSYVGDLGEVTYIEVISNAGYLDDGIIVKNIKIVINNSSYSVYKELEDIKNDISDIKDAIVGTETVPIDNSGEDHLLDKLDAETGVINDMIDEFRAFDISKYSGGIYAVMYMSTPWTNQEWFKAVMVVLLTLFALITVVRGLRR